MGRLLQIRVGAWTYSEEDVSRAWPGLAALAWPRPPQPGEKRGVLELVTALDDGLSFADWPTAVADALQDGIGQAVRLKGALEDALFRWEPREANTLSDALEEELAKLDGQAPKP